MPTQDEGLQTIAVVEIDGTLLVDDAYGVGTSVLVAEEEPVRW